MLDVLTMVSASTPMEMVQQCISSVEVAMARAGYPVKYIISPGVPGHIGKAMEQAFKRSDAPYVCWVDDDDYVLPEAFSCMKACLELRPPAIFGREIWLGARGQQVPMDRRHHLSVYRREYVEKIAPWDDPAVPNLKLIKAAPSDSFDVIEYNYVYRQRVSEAMQLRGGRRQ